MTSITDTMGSASLKRIVSIVCIQSLVLIELTSISRAAASGLTTETNQQRILMNRDAIGAILNKVSTLVEKLLWHIVNFSFARHDLGKLKLYYFCLSLVGLY